MANFPSTPAGLSTTADPNPPRAWKITQIGGTLPPIVLGASAAPYGRPRKQPLVEDGLHLRKDTVYYPGSDLPTRHFFGVKFKDFELQGRFMDRRLGAIGAANALVQQIKAMLRAQLRVRVEWGDLVVATGVLTDFTPSRESANEIAWKLTIEIDSDDAQPTQAAPTTATSPQGQLEEILELAASFPGPPDIPPDLPLNESLLDALDDLVSVVTSVTGQLASLAASIQSFQTATVAELNRLLGATGQLRTAYLTLCDTLDDATNDAAIALAPGNTQATFSETRADQRANAQFLLALLAALDDNAKEALAGKTNTTTRAQDGDTWESIALRQYGGADKADALKQANGVRGGTKPRGGRIIHLPKA